MYSREDVREYGFSVIVDARTSNWQSTKLVLHSLQEVLPGQVSWWFDHLYLVLHKHVSQVDMLRTCTCVCV